MKTKNAAAAYREATFESAPPIKLVHMLYEGALRFLEQAQGIDPKRDPAAFGDRLNRASAIVCELRVSLEPQHAPELAERLSSLYMFVEDCIGEAGMEQSHAPLLPARDVLCTLLEGWRGLDSEDL